MAKTYLDIQNSAYTVGNIMDWTNALTRLSGVPVDITEVYDSYDKAVEYAATNPVAYEGQLITVTENGDTTVYVITPAVQGTHVVGEGEEAVTYNINIKKVGTVPSGDNASITVTDAGLVSLFGFAGAENGMLPVREDGKLVWKTLEAIGAGDGNDNTTYDFALTESKTGIVVTPYFNGQPIMEGEEGAQTQKKFELVLDVYTKGEADEKFLAKADYTPYDDTELAGRVKAIEDDYLKAEDKYDDTDVKDRLDVIEGDYLKAADKYDDTELAGRVAAIEGDYLKAEDQYDDTALAGRVTTAEGKISALETESAKHATKDELADAIKDFATDTELADGLALKADKTALEALQSTVDAFLTGDGTEAALDSLKELIAYIESHDDVDIAGIIEDIEAIEGKLAGVESTVVAYVTSAIDALKIGDYAKAADLTDLAGRVEALEAKPFDTYAIKSNVEAEFAKYTTTETLTSQLADKADADKVVANDTFETFKSENTAAIGTAKSEAIAAAKTETETQVGALEDAVAETYATKTELSDAVDGIETALEDYAKTADVEAELAKKIETAQITHTTTGTTEGVTVDGTSLKIVVDTYTKEQVYTKSETDAEITKKITSINGGESAGEVKSELVDYRDALNSEIWGEEARSWTTKIEVDGKTVVTYTPQYGTTSRIDTLAEEVATAKTQADKGVADAKTANDAITALTNGAVATNTTDIGAIKTRLGTLETAKGDHETRISSAEGKITALEAADVTINTTIGTIEGNITTLQNKDAEIDGQIAALQSNKADASAVYTKEETNTAISDAIAAIEPVDLTPYLKSEDAAKTYATIAALEGIYKAGEGEAAATGILAEEIARAKAAEQKIADDLALLIENPTEALDSVKELITHVQNHGTAVEGIITRLDGHDDILAGIGGEGQPDTVIAAINAAVATVVQPKASTEITVADDGTLGIGQVSTDKLVQGVDTLVLNGGNASVKAAE